MPTKQQPNQTRFARTRRSDNGNVTSRFDRQINAIENYISRSAYGHTFKCNSHPVCRCHRALPARHRLFFERAKRFKQTKRCIAHRRILPGNLSDLLAESRKVQCPIHEQEHASRFTMSREMSKHEPGSEAKSDKHLQTHDG